MMNTEKNSTHVKSNTEKDTKVQVSRPFGTSIDNFYVTDFISENSAIMAKAAKSRIKSNLFKAKSIYN